MLTNATVKAAQPTARPYKLADAGGLYLQVRPSGAKIFRMKYRRAGKEQLLTFGHWPDLSLGDARSQRDQVRDQLRRGVDVKVNEPANDDVTFEQLARRWHAEQSPKWSPEHAADVLASLDRDVFPSLGAMAPAGIGARQVTDVLRAVERRGRVETARRLRERLSGVFRLGIHDELCSSDPAAIVGDRLSSRPAQRPQPAITEAEELRELMIKVEQLEAPPVAKLASSFLALTAVRSAALRGARWSEIEGVAWEYASGECKYALEGCEMAVWRIPPARMKLTKVKKADPKAEHVVPLSRQAVAILWRLHLLTGGGELLFPGRRTGRPIGEGAIGELYDRAGYAGRHVPHGWRAAFSTILNERFPADQALIDQALAHAGGKGKVEAAYNRAQHQARMRDLFQRWADLVAPVAS